MQLALRVVLHCKPSPFFVSDALIQDVRQLIDALASDEAECVRQHAERFRDHVTAGRFQLRDHPFWVPRVVALHCTAPPASPTRQVCPLEFRHLPSDLRSHFAASSLAIVKGDLNYRRLIGSSAK
jgi:hypothetical protein